MEIHPVIIIGAGPAGLAAGMQLIRQEITPLILERDRVGGLLWNANWVENYPGFVDGISGPDLVKLFQDQAARLGVKVIQEEVIQTTVDDGIFRIATNNKQYQSPVLIAASGTSPIKHSFGKLPHEVEKRIFTEVVPILNVKNKHIVIVGAGDAALDYSLNLVKSNRVTILNRSNHIKGLNLLWERIQKETEISYFPNSTVVSVKLDHKGKLVLITDRSDQDLEIVCDYLITAIGRKPNYSFADKSIMKSVDKLRSNNKMFLIGDVVNGSFRQTSIAVADGIRAAMIIGDLLEKG